MMELLLYVYLGVLIGPHIGIIITDFVRPKGLWNLIPTRVSGWKGDFGNKIYNIKWMNSDLDFSDWREE